MSENGPSAAPTDLKDDGADVETRLEKHISQLSTQQTYLSLLVLVIGLLTFAASMKRFLFAAPDAPQFLSGPDGGLIAAVVLISLQLRMLTTVVKDLAKTVKGLV